MGNLGHVLYCAGTTSDFRRRPFDTVEAHVSLLSRVLEAGSFASLTYLSSTRVYIHSPSTDEVAPLIVHPFEGEDIFNLSKLMGEALCLQYLHKNVRAVRVSNVLGQDFGSGNFIFSLIDDALKTGRMVLQTALESEKNYVHIDDVVDMIYRISQEGTQPVYNLAGGQNLTNAAVIEEIRAVIPANVEVMGSARTIRFAPIDISLAVREFGFSPRSVRPLIRDLAREYRLGSSF